MDEEKLELDCILVKGTYRSKSTKVAHIPREDNIPLCGVSASRYVRKDPEAWRLWTWPERRLCKRCKKKYLEKKNS